MEARDVGVVVAVLREVQLPGHLQIQTRSRLRATVKQYGGAEVRGFLHITNRALNRRRADEYIVIFLPVRIALETANLDRREKLPGGNDPRPIQVIRNQSMRANVHRGPAYLLETRHYLCPALRLIMSKRPVSVMGPFIVIEAGLFVPSPISKMVGTGRRRSDLDA